MDKLLDKRIRTILEELKGFITPVRLDVTGWKTLPCGYKPDNTVPSPDADGWQDFTDQVVAAIAGLPVPSMIRPF